MKAASGKQIAKALENKGWTLHHVRGSHHYYEKAGEVSILCVPIHGGKTLRTGTQASLMKQGGLEDADL